MLAEDYKARNSGVTFEIAAEGSTTGIAAITDGTVSGTGTATHWAITKSGTTLMATGALSASQAVTSGNVFTLGAFDIGIADAT